MRKNEADLLRFYALKCSNGFSPAAAFINKQIGLDPNVMRRTRDLLAEDGLIVVSKQSISVDWERIRLFASLKDETGFDGSPAVALQRRNRMIAPAQAHGQTRDEYIAGLLNNPKGSAKREEGLDIHCYLNWTTPQLCAWLGTLTEEEYAEWKRSINKFLSLYPEEKKCTHTIYTDKEHTTVKWADLPRGNIKLPNPNSKIVINGDNAKARKLMYPEMNYEETELVDKSPAEYLEEGWIAAYDLPF